MNKTKFPEKCYDEQVKAAEKAFGHSGPFSHESKSLKEFILQESKKRLQKYKGKNIGRIKVVE